MSDAKRRSPSGAGRFAYEGLERVLHEKARLGLVTSLVAHPAGLTFNDLKELCALTDGNLNRHLKVLQDAGLVDVQKGVRGNRPQTLCRITPAGRQRFLDYVGVLEQVVVDAAEASRAAKRTVTGWSPA
ncbi:MAG TPA: transcriptional regulator [Pirellulales bacterium]|jgi:DNA-binding MarR family transcriptional regulator|nr:transcriptional regulator [Pirellulales bacterium]